MVLNMGRIEQQHKAGFALPDFLLPEHDAIAADGTPMTVTIPLQPVSNTVPKPVAVTLVVALSNSARRRTIGSAVLG